MVHGVPRGYCVLAVVVVIFISVIGTVGCGGGASAATNPGGDTNPPASADLTVTPSSVDFSQQALNTASNAQTVTLRNSGNASMGISSITVDADFSQTNNCGSTLSASASCTVAVVFNPAATGARAGTLQISETSGKIHKVPIKGTGTAGQLVANPTSIDFGNVSTGQSNTVNVQLMNVGGSNLTVSSVSTVSTGFSVSGPTLPLVLVKGTSTTVAVKFTPSAAGSASGSVTVASSASADPLTIPLTGNGVTPGQLVSDAVNFDFGSVSLGQSGAKTVKLTNTGGAAVTVSQVTASVTAFTVSGVTVPFTVAPGASTNLNVVFAPTASGSVNGGLYIRNSASSTPLTLGLMGTGVAGQLAANPGSLDFGTVNTGQSSSKSVTLSNTGAGSLTISAVTISGAGFSLSGITVPSILAAGTSSTFNVTFTPSASGNVSGSISVTTSANSQPLTIALTGVGSTAAQLTANATKLDFGNINAGQSSVKTVTITNTGTSSLTVSSVQASGTGFSATSAAVPFTLAAGANSTITVTFAPSATGSVAGGLYIRNSSSTYPLTLNLSGVGVGTGQLTVNPTSIAFGNVTVGQTSTKTVTLSNTGTASLTISSVTTGSAGFSVSGITVPLTIAAGGSSTFSLSFAPSASGSASGSVSVLSSLSSQPSTIALTGTGVVGTLTASPTSVSFGSIAVGQSSTKGVTLSNTGTAGLTITGISTDGPGFSATGLTTPLTLAAGGSTSFSVVFSPSNSGAASGHVYISDSIRSQDVTMTLAGTGTSSTPVTHSVALSWLGSSTSTVAGYNVYRATQNGGPYTRINSLVEQHVNYSDTSVQNGTTYYYVVTAVDNSSTESVYSNQTSATIPAQ